MAKLESIENEAARYLLGELSARDRREFEARLETTAELRALIRDLEASLVALSLATPQRQPPPGAWRGIEAAVDDEVRRSGTAAWGRRVWWGIGWVAAACVFALLSYPLWRDPGAPPRAPQIQVTDTGHPAPRPPAESNSGVARRPFTPKHTTPDAEPAPGMRWRNSGDAQGLARLRTQVADLQTQLTNLSRKSAELEHLLAETNRLAFYRVTRPEAPADIELAPMSPQLRRALLAALAREWGWQGGPATNLNQLHSDSNRVSYAGIDFVDLRPVGKQPQQDPQPGAHITGIPASAREPAHGLESDNSSTTSEGGIPVLVYGNTAFVAFDSSLVPAGSQIGLEISVGSAFGDLVIFSTTVEVGANPLIVTVPMDGLAGDTGSLFLFNGTDVIGQFPPASNSPPTLNYP